MSVTETLNARWDGLAQSGKPSGMRSPGRRPPGARHAGMAAPDLCWRYGVSKGCAALHSTRVGVSRGIWPRSRLNRTPTTRIRLPPSSSVAVESVPRPVAHRCALMNHGLPRSHALGGPTPTTRGYPPQESNGHGARSAARGA